jgi:hypothetical protein
VKLPFSIATRFAFRLFLPGLVLAMAGFPMIEKAVRALQSDADAGVILLLSAIFFGWVVAILDMPIYVVFEGRRFWPRWLREHLIKSEEVRLARIRAKRAEARRAGDHNTVKELDIQEFQFPLSEQGQPHAVYPTRLGNLITEYETYPSIKYGMDGVFYWYRIWLNIDKDLRTELDEQQSIVDGFLYLSFVFYLTCGIFLLYAMLHHFFGFGLFDDLADWALICVAAASVLSGYTVYRFSLPSHMQYGELFKATFDCFHNKYDPKAVLDIIANATGQNQIRRETGPGAYRIVWRYLRWHEFRPSGSKSNINFEQARQDAIEPESDGPR